MTIEISENEMGGPTYSVSPGEKLALLPAEILELVDDFDRSVFLDPDAYLTSLAGRCELPTMRAWLLALVEGGFHRLEIHSGTVGHGNTTRLTDVYFDFQVGGTESAVSLQFRKGATPDLIHPALGPVFDLVKCIEPSLWMLAGGQLFYEDGPSGLFSVMGWNLPSDTIDPAGVRQLYNSRSGDMIGCDAGGSAIFCDHGRLEQVGPIDEFLDLYFAKLAEGSPDVAYAENMVAALKGRDSR